MIQKIFLSLFFIISSTALAEDNGANVVDHHLGFSFTVPPGPNWHIKRNPNGWSIFNSDPTNNEIRFFISLLEADYSTPDENLIPQKIMEQEKIKEEPKPCSYKDKKAWCVSFEENIPVKSKYDYRGFIHNKNNLTFSVLYTSEETKKEGQNFLETVTLTNESDPNPNYEWKDFKKGYSLTPPDFSWTITEVLSGDIQWVNEKSGLSISLMNVTDIYPFGNFDQTVKAYTSNTKATLIEKIIMGPTTGFLFENEYSLGILFYHKEKTMILACDKRMNETLQSDKTDLINLAKNLLLK